MAEININGVEPNSHKYKVEKANAETTQEDRGKVSPVIRNDQIVSTRKPFGKKFLEAFLTEDVDDIKSWFLYDILIPGIKNTIIDSISMMFFSERSSSKSSRRSRDDRTSYGRYYRSSYDRRDNDYRRKDREDRYDSNDIVDFRNIVIKERADAERVIENMRIRIRETGSATVADLLDFIGSTSKYTDNNYGWDDPRDIGIRRVSKGFLIDVSEPKYLD